MTRYQLMSIMFSNTGHECLFRDSQGKEYMGYLMSMEREDGSGRCFNLTIRTKQGEMTIFVRTQD